MNSRLSECSNIQLVQVISSFEISPNVAIVVSHDSGHKIAGADSLGSLRWQEHIQTLWEIVRIWAGDQGVGEIVVGDKVDLVIVEKL